MPDVMGAVIGFHHSTHGNSLNEVFLFLAMHIIQQVVQRFGNVVSAATGSEFVTKARDELRQVLQFLRIRQVVYSINKCLGFLAC